MSVKKHPSTFTTDYGKGAVCLAVAAVSAAVAVVLAMEAKWAGLVVFGLIALIYLAVGLWDLSIVAWDGEGVSRRLFGITLKRLPWPAVGEVGVMGTRVFNRKKPQKTGRMYIYFSEKPMTEKERFEMMLSWPPVKRIYLLYQADRLESLRRRWSGVIITYNTGDEL